MYKEQMHASAIRKLLYVRVFETVKNTLQLNPIWQKENINPNG